jgi:hypothetical protein
MTREGSMSVLREDRVEAEEAALARVVRDVAIERRDVFASERRVEGEVGEEAEEAEAADDALAFFGLAGGLSVLYVRRSKKM